MRTLEITNLSYNFITILPSNYAFDGSLSAPECKDYHGKTAIKSIKC